ncbi:hypothetical protein A6046_04090 [[Haemophilus] ducreyi]|uniref:Protein involved in oxidation of intracellular sulfur n=2 Tax=Haemophilus ducreyi TaxID=730 RepID=Q7VKJ4_HAEDU|nr:DsrH/TusB family sulfur metabolism protein [[Haemophilus] ducreyi]AAP96633.1 hypothetical protein HD_1904 [[Haemophilus] ducreyi 35000HP]AKO32925.1 hypothetical protein RZ57_07440 [[Haemophilus] ducreyi]AKO34371.1 hypothetical protein RZ58_07430 [[Haemophilus] ducreyi]AKO35816.1 hypothetical protein RZ59_07355 [[Haemophilus] ducreyi]AKO37270.1 hypothetical protein RZ61_07540 [[Haemophilus] ducreyi]
MLYTFSKANYSLDDLQIILTHITKQDIIVLWQDGVLLAVKYPFLFTQKTPVFALSQDAQARNLSLSIPTISLTEFIKLTEKYFPQIAF